MEHKVGDKAVDDVFQDTKLRDLAIAGCRGNIKDIESLIKSGVDVNGAGLDGVTPLIWTLTCENKAGFKALLEQGANPNQPSKWGMTAVLAAATYRNSEFLRILLEHDGDPNAVYDDGIDTALRAAFSTGMDRDDWTNYYMLLDAGAEFNEADEYGKTFVRFVVNMNRYCKAMELIERGYNYRFIELLHSAKLGLVIKENKDYQCRLDLIKFLETKVTADEYEAHIVMLEQKYGYKRVNSQE